MTDLKINLNDMKMNLIKLAHPNYEVMGICCDKSDILECFDENFIIDPMKDYVLPMYLVLKKKDSEELKFVKYHTHTGCAIGLMIASQNLDDISQLDKQTKEMKLIKYETKNYRSSR